VVMQRSYVLCCAVLCCAVLCCAVLCCAVLCCVPHRACPSQVLPWPPWSLFALMLAVPCRGLTCHAVLCCVLDVMRYVLVLLQGLSITGAAMATECLFVSLCHAPA
jgi:hypothetical protein